MSSIEYWQSRSKGWEKDYRSAMALAEQYREENKQLKKELQALKEKLDETGSVHQSHVSACA